MPLGDEVERACGAAEGEEGRGAEPCAAGSSVTEVFRSAQT
jgi:hypothetical protein